MWTTADSAGVFGTEAFFLDLHPLKVIRLSKILDVFIDCVGSVTRRERSALVTFRTSAM